MIDASQSLIDTITSRAQQQSELMLLQIRPKSVGETIRITQVTDVNNYKGEVLPTTSVIRPVPIEVLDAGVQSVQLASKGINVTGSFATVVINGGFSVVPTTTGFTIFYDGTNGSTQIVIRRADGYAQTLPKGSLQVTGLTPGTVGGTPPSYDVLPYYVPGSCQISWVKGTVGTPQFAFPTGTIGASALALQRLRGQEALSDGPLTIQLVAPVAPPPPTAPPPPSTGSQVGNTAVNGSLTLVVDSPGQNAVVNPPWSVVAHATDSSGVGVSGWEIYVDSILQWSTPGPLSNISQPITVADGNHTVTVHAYNNSGTMCQVQIPIQVVTPVTTVTPPATGGGGGGGRTIGCVMLGTPIEPLGTSPWHQQQLQQHEWVRVFTDKGRELIATPDHPIYTSRAGRTEMRDVRKGDYVVTITGEEKVIEKKDFVRPGFKVRVMMDEGHLFWANGILSHNIKALLTA